MTLAPTVKACSLGDETCTDMRKGMVISGNRCYAFHETITP